MSLPTIRSKARRCRPRHEPLISLETFHKIQDRLAAGARAPARKDISDDFPLRGFVLCDDCGKPLTACWSKSKTGKKHPYSVSINRPFAKVARNPRRSRGRGSARITLRLTDEEAARLERMSAGISVSAFVRECVFGDGGSRRRPRDRRPVASETELARALALLGQSRIANNLNQLAHHANTGTLVVDNEVHERIDEAYAHIVALRNALLTALRRVVDERL